MNHKADTKELISSNWRSLQYILATRSLDVVFLVNEANT